MTNVSRQYYERELGAGLGLSPAGVAGHFGYTEPLRRFIQREGWEPQANEIPNTMPSWIPGDDYFTNFRVGDPYVKISNGYARLPGAGYEALHPELEGVDPAPTSCLDLGTPHPPPPRPLSRSPPSTYLR